MIDIADPIPWAFDRSRPRRGDDNKGGAMLLQLQEKTIFHYFSWPMYGKEGVTKKQVQAGLGIMYMFFRKPAESGVTKDDSWDSKLSHFLGD